MIVNYFSKNWTTWRGFSYFGKTGIGAVYICLHWVGGFIINAIGSFQLLSKMVKSNGSSKLHKFTGRIYLVANALTCAGGLLFIFQIRTAGGWQMDTSFTIYGLLMIFCGVKTWIYAGKNTQLHFEWALRLYSIGIGSMLYRIYVLPVYLSDEHNFPSQDDYYDWVSNYLIMASWFFYFPNLLVAEFVIQYNKMKDKASNAEQESLLYSTEEHED